MPREFSAVLVKGRRNYVSLRRLALARDRASSLFPEERELAQLKELVSWAKQTGEARWPISRSCRPMPSG